MKWSEREVAKMTKLFGQQLTIIEVATLLGRSYKSVETKLRRLGLRITGPQGQRTEPYRLR